MKFSPTPKVASEIGQTMGGSLARFVGLGMGWEGGHFPAPRRPSSPPRPQAQAWRSNGAVGAKNAKMKMTEEGPERPDPMGMGCLAKGFTNGKQLWPGNCKIEQTNIIGDSLATYTQLASNVHALWWGMSAKGIG